MTILTLQGVSHAFGSRRVLGDVSFAIGARDRIGLVGINGSGKSTLLAIVSGQLVPDAGIVTRRRDLTMELVSQEPRLEAGRTVGEIVREGRRTEALIAARLQALSEEVSRLEGPAQDAALEEQAHLHEQLDAMSGWDQEYAVRGVAAALELAPLESRVETLSIGERRRVALARALLARPELLVLDEPTNHLDARTIEWLEAELVAQPGAVLLVTHDRYFLDRVATRIFELDRGVVVATEGNYTRFLEKQAERLALEEDQERARASFVRRELTWIKRGPKARGTKQQARIQRFDAAVAAGDAFLERGAHDKRMSLSLPVGGRLGKTVLELRGLGRTVGGKTLFRGLDLLVKPGDRIGVVGPNGAGKTTLVRTILGLERPDEGEIIVGQNTRFASLDQGRTELRDDRTVMQEVADGAAEVELGEGSVPVRTFLRMMLFDDAFADTPVGVLSGGERSRVQLAKLLRQGGNFLVLDEPTNDLDLVTLSVLEEALAGFGGCALVVSHDRWFLDRVATAVLVFEGDGRVGFYEGGYEQYLQSRPKPVAAAPTAPQAPPRVRPAGPKKLTHRERAELSGMEAAVLAAEARVTELEATLSDPAVYRDRALEVPALVTSLAEARAETERLYTRWQELESIGDGVK